MTLIFAAIMIGGIIYVTCKADNYLDRRGIVSDLEESDGKKVINVQTNK